MAAHAIPKLDLEAMLVQRLDANRIRLPPYPGVALKLQQLASEARCSTQELGKTISVDAALAAIVLYRANCVASGPVAHITSLEAAIRRLGIDPVLRIVLAHSIGAVANTKGPLAVLRRLVWRRSLLAARMAQELAAYRGIDPNEAFTAGLLHDFGAITVLAGLEDLPVELPVLPAEQWRVFVDRLQARFGSTIAERWKLPAAFADTIRYCNSPASYRGPARALVELIGTAVQAIDVLERAPETGIAALLEIPTLGSEERYRIGALVKEIAELMDAFEPVRQVEPPPVAVAPATTMDGGWPIRFVVTSKRDGYEARAITPNELVLRGGSALVTNWLVELELHCTPVPFSVLANVKSCRRDDDGQHTIVVAPFALGGKTKELWAELVNRTRPR